MLDAKSEASRKDGREPVNEDGPVRQLTLAVEKSGSHWIKQYG